MSAKPEPEWMPSDFEINDQRAKDTELFALYSPQFNLRRLIRATAIKAQIAVLEDLIKWNCFACRDGRVRHADSGTPYHCSSAIHWPCPSNEFHERADALRAELAEIEKGA